MKIIRTLSNIFKNIGLKPDGQTEFQGDLAVRGSLSALALATPDAPTITNVGTGGAVTYGYKVVATVNSMGTAASAEGTTATGNATLDSTNYNVVTWTKTPGATGYKIYRTTGGSTPPMLISTVTSANTLTYNDQDKTSGSSETPSTVNRTGAIKNRSKVITITRDLTAATGSVAYTGIGFKPSALLVFFYVGATASGYRKGEGTCSSDLSQQSVHVNTSGTVTDGGAKLINIEPSSGSQDLEITSYDADGFTGTWTKAGTPSAATLTAIIQALE